MRLPQRAEDRFFKVSACASKIHSTPPTDKDELAGDESREFADLENAMGRAVVDHGNSSRTKRDIGAPEVACLNTVGSGPTAAPSVILIFHRFFCGEKVIHGK